MRGGKMPEASSLPRFDAPYAPDDRAVATHLFAVTAGRGRDDRIDANVRPRPDSLYGVSKAFGEDLASLYADKYGLEIACLRIGTAKPEPSDPRHLSTWQSYEDLLRLIKACFAAPRLGCTILYGVSDNDRRWWSNAAAATMRRGTPIAGP